MHLPLSPPGCIRLESHHRFHHGQRRRVSGGFRPADFAFHAADFRERLNQLVGLLENLPGRGNADTRVGGRHVEQVTLV